MEKLKKKIQSLIHYMSWKNISSEVKTYGYEISVKSILIIFLVYFFLTVVAGFMFKLTPPFMSITLMAGFIFLPAIIMNAYKQRFEQQKFSDVSQYIEQMLYSFRGNKKILTSLKEVEPLFANGPMGKLIREAEQLVTDKNIEVALDHIEKEYDCNKMKQAHKVLIEAERRGGDVDDTIELLLVDRTKWVDRTLDFQKEKKQKKTTIMMSIITSYLICIIMERILPSQVNISNLVLTQVTSTLLFIASLFIYYLTDKSISVSWLKGTENMNPNEVRRYYKYIMNYDAKTEFMKSLKMLVIPIILVLLAFYTAEWFALVLAAFFAVFILLRHKIVYAKRLKLLKKEITIQFPRWLMEMALLMQSNNVQVALYKSINSAGEVLKPELIKLSNALTENPNASLPYIEFMKFFDMPEITSSMKLFYAISNGSGGDVNQQIRDIINRNNLMLDKAERLANENSIAGMYMLFLSPQIFGGAKLMIDMVVFFLAFMGNFGDLGVY